MVSLTGGTGPRWRLLPFSHPMTCQNVSQVAGAEASVLDDKNSSWVKKHVESQGGKLGGGFKYFLFSTLFGEDCQFD